MTNNQFVYSNSTLIRFLELQTLFLEVISNMLTLDRRLEHINCLVCLFFSNLFKVLF